jgi:hypothetical protein
LCKLLAAAANAFGYFSDQQRKPTPAAQTNAVNKRRVCFPTQQQQQ